MNVVISLSRIAESTAEPIETCETSGQVRSFAASPERHRIRMAGKAARSMYAEFFMTDGIVVECVAARS